MKTRVLSLAILAVLLQPLAAAAGPIFALGTECPADAQMGGSTRQYYVTPAIGCAYDTDDTLKDGGDPKFGIFVLPPGVLTGAWGFGTAAGDLSHFALYARGTPGPPNDDEPPSPVPEPASMLLLGTGLLAAARARARAR